MSDKDPELLSDEQKALIGMLREDAENRWMGGSYGAVRRSVAHNPSDPAFWMITDGTKTKPVVHRKGCYICEDPEFAVMGLPLCRPCPQCLRNQEACQACNGTGATAGKEPCSDCLATGLLGVMGHIAADGTRCDDCGYEDGPEDYPGAGA